MQEEKQSRKELKCHQTGVKILMDLNRSAWTRSGMTCGPASNKFTPDRAWQNPDTWNSIRILLSTSGVLHCLVNLEGFLQYGMVHPLTPNVLLDVKPYKSLNGGSSIPKGVHTIFGRLPAKYISLSNGLTCFRTF